MQKLNTQEISEIIPGLLVLKHCNSTISHNCDKATLKITGNCSIKFENCEEINMLNKTFTNVLIKLYNKIILSNYITKIKDTSNTTLAYINKY